MQDFTNTEDWSTFQRRNQPAAWRASGVYLFALGAYLTYAFIDFTVVQPTVRQMSQLEQQVASLETNIRQLTGQRGVAGATNALLGQLVEQNRRTIAARESLDQIAELNERLYQQADRVTWARGVAEQLMWLQDDVLANADRVTPAAHALRSIESLLGRLSHQYDSTIQSHLAVDALDRISTRLQMAEPTAEAARTSLDTLLAMSGQLVGEAESNAVASDSLANLVELKRMTRREAADAAVAKEALAGLVDLKDGLFLATIDLSSARDVAQQWACLERQLANSGPQICEARQTTNQFLNMADDLVCRGDTMLAQRSLDDLIGIRRQLDEQTVGLDLAGQRLDQLIGLKDQALSQTTDLVRATENLELVSDLHNELASLTQSFARMRPAIIEILAFEPVFNRAMRTLQPLIDLGNLRHLSSSDLRQVIRTIGDRRETQFGGAPDYQPTARFDVPVATNPQSERPRAE